MGRRRGEITGDDRGWRRGRKEKNTDEKEKKNIKSRREQENGVKKTQMHEPKRGQWLKPAALTSWQMPWGRVNPNWRLRAISAATSPIEGYTGARSAIASQSKQWWERRWRGGSTSPSFGMKAGTISKTDATPCKNRARGAADWDPSASTSEEGGGHSCCNRCGGSKASREQLQHKEKREEA
jgi:hypothetical protein